MKLQRKAGGVALALALVGGALALAGTGSSEAAAAASGAPSWTIQPGGKLGFSVVNDGSDTIAANFSKWGGTIQFDPDNPGAAAIHIDVDLSSAVIGNSFQDELLQGAEFFDSGNGPTATFESSSVDPQPDGHFVAHGMLGLRGMSMPQDIEFTLSGSGAQRHVEGNATVDRVAYDIGNGSHGGGLDEGVKVAFAFDATRQ